MRVLLRRYSTPMCAMFGKLCQICLMRNLVTFYLRKNLFNANATRTAALIFTSGPALYLSSDA